MKPEKNGAGAGKGGATRFQKGQTGNPKGRPKGVPNKVTLEAKAFCGSLVDDPIYQARLLKDLRAGTLAPAIEQLVWYYAKGKPKEMVEHSGPDGEPIQVKQYFLPHNGREA